MAMSSVLQQPRHSGPSASMIKGSFGSSPNLPRLPVKLVTSSRPSPSTNNTAPKPEVEESSRPSSSTNNTASKPEVEESSSRKPPSRLIRIGDAIGQGTFGKVYQAKSPGGKDYAVKCHFSDKYITGLGCARELDLNHKTNHPHIILLEVICDGNPFKGGNVSPPKERYQRLDKTHFIYPKASCNLHRYYADNIRTMDLKQIKQIIVEILLGLEYIHGCGLIHRDIKPENILVFKEEKGVNVRICDFGLAIPFAKGIPLTPGVVTSWYRPPEVYLSSYYNQNIDVWSAGCIMYELIVGHPLLPSIKDIDDLVVRETIKSLPYVVSDNLLQNMCGNNVRKFNSVKVTNHTPRSMENFLSLKPESKIIFDANGGFDNFKDLLLKMLQFDPSRRISSRDALNHPFFDDHKPYIESIRSKYRPIRRTIATQIHECIERKWMGSIVYGIWKNKQTYKSWYSDRILFHSIDLFDRVLAHKSKDQDNTVVESESLGKIFSYKDAVMYFTTCLYISIKYFQTLRASTSLASILDRSMRTSEYITRSEETEKYILSNILKWDIYHDTTYDALCKTKVPTLEEVHSLLIFTIHGYHKNQPPADAVDSWRKHIFKRF